MMQPKSECCNVNQAVIPQKSQGSVYPRFSCSLVSLLVCQSVMGEEFRSKCQGASRQYSVVGLSVVITFPELSAWSPPPAPHSPQSPANCFNSSVQHDCPLRGHFSLQLHSWTETDCQFTKLKHNLSSYYMNIILISTCSKIFWYQKNLLIFCFVLDDIFHSLSILCQKKLEWRICRQYYCLEIFISTQITRSEIKKI